MTGIVPGSLRIKLRDYQTEAVGAALDSIDGGLHSPAEVLPTGAGKTVVFAGVISEWLGRPQLARSRVIVLAHRTELIEQAADKIRSVAPRLQVGIVKAERNETLAQVIVASVQTLASKARRDMIRDVSMIVVDECHHAAAPTYRAVLNHYRVGEPGGAVALGVTATLSRGDGKALGDVWQDVVYERSIAQMVRDQWLVRPRGIRVWVDDFDLSRVRSSRGDYSEGDLGRAIIESQVPEAVAKALTEHALRMPTIVFAPTVASADAIREAVEAAGFTTGLVHGAMPPDERRATLDAFRQRALQVLCNCMVLTEGTDLPLAECCVIARPTKHHGLYIQMAGRVLRPSPGKTGALILDVVGASQKHSLQAHVELFGEALDDDETKAAKAKAEEGLIDLDEMLDGDAAPEGRHYGIGALVSEEIDLFHSAESAWGRTAGGVWFLPAVDRYIVVHRGANGWDISSVDMYRTGPGTARYVAEGIPDLTYARAAAEEDMTKAERRVLSREAQWRHKAPTTGMRKSAAIYGVKVERGMTGGEVMRLISERMASARLDRFVTS